MTTLLSILSELLREGEVSSAVNIPQAPDVYDLITRHFLANLMLAAIFEKTHLHLLVQEDPFDSSGTVLKNSGWLEVIPLKTKKISFSRL